MRAHGANMSQDGGSIRSPPGCLANSFLRAAPTPIGEVQPPCGRSPTRERSRWYDSCKAPEIAKPCREVGKMRLVLALTAAVLLAVPSGPARAANTCHGPSCAHGG